MTDPAALQRLLTWLSPAFPVGSFAWSAGLETAIVEGPVRDAAAARAWIEANLRHGSIRSDAILLAHAHRGFARGDTLREIAELCLALIPARERRQETVAMGDAFVVAARAWPSPHYEALPVPAPYPVAVGAVAAAHDIPLHDTLLAFLTACVQAQVSVAVRLVPVGQSEGLAIQAALEPVIAAEADAAQHAALADVGGMAYASDVAQMRHETLPTRIFRS